MNPPRGAAIGVTGSVTVGQALASARARGVSLLDAQILISQCLGCSRSWLIAHDDAELSGSQQEQLGGLLNRLLEGEPLAYLTGEKEFRSLKLGVSRAVLIPRPETEHLVEWGLEVLTEWLSDVSQPRVIDLGTGSGAIALAIKSAHPCAVVAAVDASAEALQIARANATSLGLEIACFRGHWWAAAPGATFDLALCNPPYIATGDPHLAALRHEPVEALTAGDSGLEAVLAVIADAPAYLSQGAWLLFEHGFNQAKAIRLALHEQGFVRIETRLDLAGAERCTGGAWLGADVASGWHRRAFS